MNVGVLAKGKRREQWEDIQERNCKDGEEGKLCIMRYLEAKKRKDLLGRWVKFVVA